MDSKVSKAIEQEFQVVQMTTMKADVSSAIKEEASTPPGLESAMTRIEQKRNSGKIKHASSYAIRKPSHLGSNINITTEVLREEDPLLAVDETHSLDIAKRSKFQYKDSEEDIAATVGEKESIKERVNATDVKNFY